MLSDDGHLSRIGKNDGQRQGRWRAHRPAGAFQPRDPAHAQHHQCDRAGVARRFHLWIGRRNYLGREAAARFPPEVLPRRAPAAAGPVRQTGHQDAARALGSRTLGTRRGNSSLRVRSTSSRSACRDAHEGLKRKRREGAALTPTVYDSRNHFLLVATNVFTWSRVLRASAVSEPLGSAPINLSNSTMAAWYDFNPSRT